MIDWDLEAPGLHRFFGGLLLANGSSGQSGDDHPGLIELFDEMKQAIDKVDAGSPSDAPSKQSKQAADQIVNSVDLDKYILPTVIDSLSLIKAGRFDTQYSTFVGKFQWEALYGKRPWLFRSLADRLASKYSYVLIDSRTGLNDTSGICTSLMPEKLVLVFTPSLQSILGVLETVRKVTSYRRSSPDVRKLVIYPLPSRIEISETKLREDWQLGNPREGIEGWQPMFESTLAHVYGLSKCSLGPYFSKIQIRQSSSFAYGEQIAVLNERSADTLSLSSTYIQLAEWLAQSGAPWEELAGATATVSEGISADWLAAQADGFYGRLKPYEQAWTRQVLLRLVSVRPSFDGPLAPIHETVDSLPLEPEERSILDALERNNLITRSRVENNGTEMLQLANSTALLQWPQLQRWISDNRPFLEWLTKIRSSCAEWTKTHESSLLLRGKRLQEAKSWLKTRPSDLNRSEVTYINASSHRILRMRIFRGLASLLAIGALILGTYYSYRGQKAKQLVVSINAATDGAKADALIGQLETIVGSNDASVAVAFATAGGLYHKAKNEPSAALDYQKALSAYKAASGDHQLGQAGVLIHLGEVYFALDDTKQSKEYYSSALKIYEAKAPNDPGAASALVGLAQISEQVNALSPKPSASALDARLYVERALQIYGYNNNTSVEVADAWAMLGDISNNMKDFEKSIACYQQAAATYMKNDPLNSELLSIYYRLGQAGEQAGKPGVAEEGYRKVIDLYGKNARKEDRFAQFVYNQVLDQLIALLRKQGRKSEIPALHKLQRNVSPPGLLDSNS